MTTTAVLLTAFNRRDTTIRCLNALFLENANFDVFLVDDNSSDGTYESVSNMFPQVRIIKGTGNLFWNRGMQLAWEEAVKAGNYDYYLWLNDDVILYPGWFHEILQCSRIAFDKAVIVGIIEAHDKSSILYGGIDEQKRLIMPNGQLQHIVNMNGNVVLVPKSVYAILGNLDPYFHHDLGDVDYGLRAAKCGIRVFSTRSAVGSGDKNGLCRVRKWNSNITDRFKKLYSPLGSPPAINFYFRRRHYGFFNALQYYLFIHVINILPDRIIKALFGNKYM